MTQQECDDLATSLMAQDAQARKSAEAKRRPPKSWIEANFPDGPPGRTADDGQPPEWTDEQLRRLDDVLR